jgi:hypothetical protein
MAVVVDVSFAQMFAGDILVRGVRVLEPWMVVLVPV